MHKEIATTKLHQMQMITTTMRPRDQNARERGRIINCDTVHCNYVPYIMLLLLGLGMVGFGWSSSPRNDCYQ